MPSSEYNIVNRLYGLMPVKKLLSRKGDDLVKILKMIAKRQSNEIPWRLFEISDVDYNVRYSSNCPCVIIRSKDTVPQKAVLYCSGGAYILSPKREDYLQAIEIANQTEAEVWMVIPPLAPDHTLNEILSCFIGYYEEMLGEYEAQEIIVYGSSSGATTSLFMCLYNRYYHLGLPMPRHLILISPAIQMPPSAAQLKKMARLDKYDKLIPVTFTQEIVRIVGDDHTFFLMKPFRIDWSDFPSMDIFYGTHEIFYAYANDLENQCRQYGISYRTHYAKGMMHGWHNITDTPEGREARAQVIAIIKQIAVD